MKKQKAGMAKKMQSRLTTLTLTERHARRAGNSPFIPLASPGASADIYDEEDIRLDHLFAKASVITLAPQDDPDNEC